MSAKTFLDTNILVYAHDTSQGRKHQIAQAIVRELWNLDAGAVSMQVLQEFYINVTRKISRPISKTSARNIVEDFAAWCFYTTPAEISEAFRIEDRAKISFWDAPIIATAQKSGADRVLSEDLNFGQTIAGIRIENPFVKPA